MSRYYDAKAINRDVKIQDVFACYGLENKTGKNIPCINSDWHKNGDKKPSAIIYPDNNICWCNTCAKAYTPISVVMEMEKVGFIEACQRLVNEFSLDDTYYEENEFEETESSNYFPLSPDDYELLGFKSGFGEIVCQTNIDLKHWEYDEYNDTYSPDIEPIQETYRYGLRDLWKENKPVFKDLVLRKIAEAMPKYEVTSNEFARLCDIYDTLELDKLAKKQIAISEYKETQKGKEKMVIGDKIYDIYCLLRDNNEDLTISYKCYDSLNYKNDFADISAINEDKNAVIFRIGENGELQNYFYKDYVYEKGTIGEEITIDEIPEDFQDISIQLLDILESEKESPSLEYEEEEEEMAM